MIDHGMGAEVDAPFLRFRPGRGGDDGKSGETARKLDQDRADAAGPADNQQRARVDTPAGQRTQAVEQQFP